MVRAARVGAILVLCIGLLLPAVTAKPGLAGTMRASAAQTGKHMDRHARPLTLNDFLNSGSTPAPLETVPLYGSLTLACEFRGSPPPTVDWYRDGTLLHKTLLGDALEEETNSVGELLEGPSRVIAATWSRLHLECVTPRHQGKYTCRAQSAHGVASSSTQLYVAGPADEGDMFACEQAKDMPFRPARIVQWRSKLLARMGDRVHLICAATGYPAAAFAWTKFDRPVSTDGGRVKVTADGTLVIEDLQWADMGMYRCRVNNELGSDEVTTFLYPVKSM